MSQYCDSQRLENNWFQWILSSSVPQLEDYRKLGVLWTKVIGCAKHDGQPILVNGKSLPDPSYPIRKHCLVLDQPLFFTSCHGQIPETATTNGRSLEDPPVEIEIPFSQINITSAQPDLANILVMMGYTLEIANSQSWHSMLEDIRNICNGISMKFHLRNEEEQQDLASDALIQVTNKLVSGRLVYMPGRAPVFNLLTTTTYRIMYSISNKKNSQRNSMRKLIDDAAAGILPNVGRSVRVPTIRNQALLKHTSHALSSPND